MANCLPRDPEDHLTITSSHQKYYSSSIADPDDPLRWPLWLKIAILIQVSILAALGGLNTASINPAYAILAKDFGISKVRASYQTTICIALNGIAPWLWIPLANKYGRRPIYLATTTLGFASALGCAYTRSYAELLVARVFNGLFPAAFALGAATVVDLFPFHQRGRAMGVFTVTTTTGSHLAPIVGGLLGQYCGWRWIFKFCAIIDATMVVVAFFCLPETLYIREDSSPATLPPTSPTFTRKIYLSRLRLITPNPTVTLRSTSFLLSTLKLVLSPTALFPALYYAINYGFASILPAVTAGVVFADHYHWTTLRIGLSYGSALTVGSLLGELFAGWVIDHLATSRHAKLPLTSKPEPSPPLKDPSHAPPAPTTLPPPTPTTTARLYPLLPANLLLALGLLLYGFTLQYHTTPALPLLGMALSCFALQILTTATYTFSIESHHHQPHSPTKLTTLTTPTTSSMTTAADVAQLFNIARQEFGMTFAFYAVRLGERIGYEWESVLFAGVGGGLAFAPVAWLMWRGRTRERNRDRNRNRDRTRDTGGSAGMEGDEAGVLCNGQDEDGRI